MFADVQLGRAVPLKAAPPLVDAIADAVTRHRSAMPSVTRLKTRNEYAYLHSVAVCALMLNLARQPGLGAEQAGLGGLLHDVGKMTLPAALLNKPDALDEDERRLMRSHPEAGHALLRRTAGVSAIALDVTLNHHERVDGGGHPHGLSGDRLTRFAHMAAIRDVYDALTSGRPLVRAFWDVERARPIGREDVVTGAGGDQVTGVEDPARWFGDAWAGMAAGLRADGGVGGGGAA